MVVDGFRWFKVVLGGCRSFHVLVTTYYYSNCDHSIIPEAVHTSLSA